MLISISGSHSVGKTTLAERLVEDLNSSMRISLIPEAARILIKKHFFMNQHITEWGIVNYLHHYLCHERLCNLGTTISDRSLIDLLSYLIVNKSSKIRNKYIYLVEEIVFEESKRFDYYFYLPIEFPISCDNVRPFEISYQKKLTKLLYIYFSYIISNRLLYLALLKIE